jgi:hypothetical protein
MSVEGMRCSTAVGMRCSEYEGRYKPGGVNKQESICYNERFTRLDEMGDEAR